MTKDPSLDPDELFREARAAFEPAPARVTAVREAIGVRVGLAAAAGAAASSSAETASATVSTTASAAAAGSGTTSAVTTTASWGAAHWISAGVLATVVASGAFVATRDAAPRAGAPQTHASKVEPARPALSAAPLGAQAPAPIGQPLSSTERLASDSKLARDSKLVPEEARPVTPTIARKITPARAPAGTSKIAHAAAPLAASAQAMSAPQPEPKLEPTPQTAAAQPALATLAAKVEPPAPFETLAQEIVLLRKARSALEGKRARESLALLETYAELFPRGTLRQEALATRVLALCEVEGKVEARSVAKQLARLAPSSPHLIRLASSCAMQDDSSRADDDAPSK